MRVNRVLFAISVLLIAILACDASGGQTAPTPDLPGTITAQALALQAPSNTPTSTNTPAPLNSPTPAFTPTSSVPMVSVTSPTNCRTGPGTVYDLVFSMNPGESAEIVGKDTPDNYWIIDNPSGGTCWLWGQYAVISGTTEGLQEYPPPPTPTPAEPAAPKNFKGTAVCSSSGTLFIENVHVSLTWTDVANNEDGYHIYRDDQLLASLAPNTTSLEDDTTFRILLVILGHTPPPPPSVKYGIEAFNAAGSSNRKEVTLHCP